MSGAAPRASLSRAGETAATGQTGPNRRPSVSVRLLSRDIPRAAAAPAVARRMPSDGFCSHSARSERAAGVACTGRAGGGDRPRRVETAMLGLHDGYPPRLARRGTCVGRDGSSARPLIRRSHAAEGRGSARAGATLTALGGSRRAISRACRPCTESGEGAHDRFGHLDHRGAAAAASAAEGWGGLLEHAPSTRRGRPPHGPCWRRAPQEPGQIDHRRCARGCSDAICIRIRLRAPWSTRSGHVPCTHAETAPRVPPSRPVMAARAGASGSGRSYLMWTRALRRVLLDPSPVPVALRGCPRAAVYVHRGARGRHPHGARRGRAGAPMRSRAAHEVG